MLVQCHNPYFNRWFSAMVHKKTRVNPIIVTILILIDGFLQLSKGFIPHSQASVTILILIDGFLQLKTIYPYKILIVSHNPYFNRWFSAILVNDKNKVDRDLSQSLF